MVCQELGKSLSMRGFEYCRFIVNKLNGAEQLAPFWTRLGECRMSPSLEKWATLLFLQKDSLNNHKNYWVSSQMLGFFLSSAKHIRAINASLSKSLCREIPGYFHIPSTSYGNKFLFQMSPSRLAGRELCRGSSIPQGHTNHNRQLLTACLSPHGSSSVGLS